MTAPETTRTSRWATFKNLCCLLALLLAAVVTVFVRTSTGLSYVWAYLIGINVVTLLLYGYDKSVAKLGWLRVPEVVMHCVTLFGGTPAALLGQNLFNHKTAKGSFRRMFWLIVLVQIAVFGAWIYFTRDTGK